MYHTLKENTKSFLTDLSSLCKREKELSWSEENDKMEWLRKELIYVEL